MKKSICTLLALGLFFPALGMAGEAVVSWKDFKDYRDVRPSNETRVGFHKRIASSFEKYFAKLAEQLPEGSKLTVKVNELDLAGDVIFGVNEIRVVKSVYIPQMKFDYSLTDKQGNPMAEGNADLKDLSFMDRVKSGRDTEFYYEKRMINDWFEKELLPKVTK